MGRPRPRCVAISREPCSAASVGYKTPTPCNKIRFLPSGNSLGNELGYPLVTESRFFLLIGLFFLHNGLDNLGSELAVLVILLHFDSLCQ